MRRTIHDTAPFVSPELDRLTQVVDSLESVAVAFSAGVDSTLVLKVCVDRLGKDHVLAVVGVSPSLPHGELEEARALAERIGAELLEVETSELEEESYRSNPDNRCFFCRQNLYRHLGPLAEQRRLRHIVDGTHVGDLGDDRPGIRASDDAGVRHPLLEAGLGKDEIRDLARTMDLPNWDKPALACLSSRVPHGTPITAPLLDRIGRAELSLKALGLTSFRVRSHGDVARLEVAPAELATAFEQREHITRVVRSAGFRFVSLDLEGYRTGSLNATRES